MTCDFTNCQRFAEFSVGLFGKDQHAFPNERGDECSRGCAHARPGSHLGPVPLRPGKCSRGWVLSPAPSSPEAPRRMPCQQR